MNPLALTESALIAAKRAIKEGQCRDPAVTFRDCTDIELNAQESRLIRAALRDRNNLRIGEVMESSLTERYGTWAMEEHGFLDLCVFEREKCSPGDLCEIGGLTFAIPVNIREALRGHLLDHASGHYVLRCGDRTFSTLMGAIRHK